jgi:hypothetical protein
MTAIKETKYRGRLSISICSDEMEAVFFHDNGNKMASLKSLDSNYEFLWQGKEGSHPLPDDGEAYVENDLCGADDIFPSINECFYPSDPWKGLRCPPHGELWNSRWQYRAEGSKAVFTSRGTRLPYIIEKTVSFKDPRTLRFDYKLTNLSLHEMPGIWAWHPLFIAHDDTEIILPEGTGQIINSLDFHSRLGRSGTIHSWPITTDRNGSLYEPHHFVPDCGICEKFFTYGNLKEGKVSLERKKPGTSLSVSFPAAEIPYLGIWINQGGLLGQNNIAVEPATGSLDDLCIAEKWDMVTRFQPETTYRFWLEIGIY